MYRELQSFDCLMDEVRTDKKIEGSVSVAADRYPVRFVLFDNFRDSFEFVAEMQSNFGCRVESVNDWIDAEYPDMLITHSKLAKETALFIQEKPKYDYVIAPFSELARFYDNKRNFEFNALVRTLKAIENPSYSQTIHRRVYIPIVGLEGKLLKYASDSQIFIWYYKNTDKQLNYKLILTNNTVFGVQNLDSHYTVVGNIQQWLRVWRDRNAKQNIVSTSVSLFANAEYAQPDNAFTFTICNNAYEFLTKGLKFDFGTMKYAAKDEPYWQRLASKIDITNFSFEKFFNSYFHIDDLSDYRVFIKIWFDSHDDFERWLLTNYYAEKCCQQGYLCQVIGEIENYSDYHLFSALALAVFRMENKERYLEERLFCLQRGAEKEIVIPIDIQNELVRQLKDLAEQSGYSTAIRYFSPLTQGEKHLAIEWVGKNKVTAEQVKPFFADLYHYLGKSFGTLEPPQKWVLEYLDVYKRCKVANQYSEDIADVIRTKNASPVAFDQWYQQFKTVKTVLGLRSDIDIYYWVDGLGADWIPFIAEQIKQEQNIYLNEVIIAVAKYPTITSINKPLLQDLSVNELQKIGDLDELAHKTGNRYPEYVVEEMKIVKNGLRKIVNDYAGKKIAIVSDHGLTALSQLGEGLNMAGVDSDHHGRVAIRHTGKSVSDNNYVLCEDGKTMCALRHESLCGKVPKGQSVHGGCTPEEILVPIFIISSQKNASTYSARLISSEVSGVEPVVRYSIKGVNATEPPYVIYNGRRYELIREEGNVYCSERLLIEETNHRIELYIGSFMQSSELHFKLGAVEDDLFDF